MQKSALAAPLLDKDEPDDPFMWVRLIATVTAVSLGSSLQFGFATGSLNNLEQIVPATLANLGNPINIATWAIINSCFSIGGLIGSYGVVIPLALLGRKKTLLITNIFVFISSAFMYFGTTWYSPQAHNDPTGQRLAQCRAGATARTVPSPH